MKAKPRIVLSTELRRGDCNGGEKTTCRYQVEDDDDPGSGSFCDERL